MATREHAPNPTSKRTRPYRSELRAQAASQTRTTILDAAMRLFLERGYGKVTINDIAQQAGLATPTVYASTGGKAAILSTLIGERQYGDPVVESTLEVIRKSHTSEEVVAAIASGTRVNNQRFHDISQVMVTAAAVDDAAAEILQRSDEWYRGVLSQGARRMKSLRGLHKGIGEKRATDILWYFFGRQSWHLLVYDLRWSWDATESFLNAQAATALILDRC
ncbi:TetR/AcrR family transcriptional regulator [Mycobacterium vicinigordonae]|uniref:TetR/AcrR family transcriptional regulator n=1 Tax=Mycobacterium vicinigordonae TaxID=1719132 RepID=A0A7D6HY78_9MYCO|nr:TetR/AcrR family transcriptional regulator [Mycobacterium vicinigordonae]QLL07635.1 TetR/AcrR family transcriptional regulator [Mycobacterium vicinigordonae]